MKKIEPTYATVFENASEEHTMFEIFADSHFSAGHHLRDYPGDCEKPHGHNWKVRVAVCAETTDSIGMGIDFRDLKKIMKDVLDTLDHCDLNEHPSFQDTNPSSEHLAVYIYDQVADRLTGTTCSVSAVTVRETDTTGVIYRGSPAASCCR